MKIYKDMPFGDQAVIAVVLARYRWLLRLHSIERVRLVVLALIEAEEDADSEDVFTQR